MFPCCECGEEKGMSGGFSAIELRKYRPRCCHCVSNNNPILADLRPVPGDRFRRCKHKRCHGHWQPVNEFDVGKEDCNSCLRADGVEERQRVYTQRMNETDRTRAGGACKVKEVQARYGHICEIPLQAYIEADVAHDMNDFVTAEDVKAASNAWDAHEIDTQWGSKP